MNLQIKILGLGGIGSILSEELCQFLHYYQSGLRESEAYRQSMEISGSPPQFENIYITLIDGDTYEPRNRERQNFSRIGLKSDIKILDLSEKFTSLSYYSVPEYLDENNISRIITSGDILFMGVDNHKTRRIVNDYCRTLDNIIIFSGGNSFHTGNVQRYIRKNGVDLRPHLTKYHPEIENAQDKLPNELGCEELHEVDPQLLLINSDVAAEMVDAFYTEIIRNIDTNISDAFIDLKVGQKLVYKYSP